MLRPRRKITKRELKQDKLVSTYFKAQNLLVDYKRHIGVVVLGAVVLLVAGVIYYNNRLANEQKAAAELGKVFTYYDGGSYKLAIDGIPEKNVLGLKSIADNYGSTPSGELATFYLGSAYYMMNDYENALKYYQEFDTSDKLLKASGLSGIAACYELKGKYAEAAKYFERAARISAGGLLTSENLRNAARNYALAGEKERAVEIYEEIRRDFPGTPAAREAEQSLAELSV